MNINNINGRFVNDARVVSPPRDILMTPVGQVRENPLINLNAVLVTDNRPAAGQQPNVRETDRLSDVARRLF